MAKEVVSTLNKEQAAYAAAGQAVYAALRGFDVSEVSLDPNFGFRVVGNGRIDGYVPKTVEGYSFCWTAAKGGRFMADIFEHAQTNVAVVCAGAVAARKATGTPYNTLKLHPEIERLAVLFGAEFRGAVLTVAMGATKDQIEKYWSIVETIATDLLADRPFKGNVSARIRGKVSQIDTPQPATPVN